MEELIDYTQELEGKVVERKIDDTYNKEEVYLQIIRDIYESCSKIIEDQQLSERFKETPPVDFQEVIKNLKKYLDVMSRHYRIVL